VLRLATILIGHTYKIRLNDHHFDFGFEAGRIAKSIVEGHGYGNPFNGPSGPTAWLPPLYPLLIAVSFKLFGVYTNAAALALMVVNSIASAAIAPLVYEIAARCFDARGLARRASKQAAPVALWSAWIWAIHPAAMQYAVHWLWEMSLTTLFFTGTIVLVLRLRCVGEVPAALLDFNLNRDARLDGRNAMLRWAALGLLWGLITLLNPSLLLALFAEVAWLLWPRRSEGFFSGSFAKSIANAALCGLVMLAVITPWIVRNQRTLHAFVPTRSNFGVELYQSTLEVNNGLPWGTSMPLWPGAPEFREYVRVGEIAYSKHMGELGKQRIAANPAQFWRWTALRVQYFWAGTPHAEEKHPASEYLRQLHYSFISVCGVLGLLLMLRRHVPGAWLFAMIFALTPAVYYAITVQPRFRHPIEPLMAILAVYLFRSADTDRVWSIR
jgi:hypothetical protein